MGLLYVIGVSGPSIKLLSAMNAARPPPSAVQPSERGPRGGRHFTIAGTLSRPLRGTFSGFPVFPEFREFHLFPELPKILDFSSGFRGFSEFSSCDSAEF